jgi:hypothetical protein
MICFLLDGDITVPYHSDNIMVARRLDWRWIGDYTSSSSRRKSILSKKGAVAVLVLTSRQA